MFNKHIRIILVAWAFGLFVSGAAQSADPDLVGWWTFDEGEGTIAFDASGRENDGTLVGDPVWIAGQLGGALEFDGVMTFVEVPYSPDFDAPAEVTLAAWINPYSLHNWCGVITCGTEALPYAMETWGDGGIRMSMGWGGPVGAVGEGFFNSGVKMTTNEWQHIACRFDGTRINYFLNGVKDSTEYEIDFVIGTTVGQALTLGADFPGGDEYLEGALDDARVYHRALRDQDILQVMEGAAELDPYVFADALSPTDGSVQRSKVVVASWEAGDLAASHDVYLGTDFDDVNNATRDSASFLGNMTQTQISFGLPVGDYPTTLEVGTTYYWRVDEINDTEAGSPWKGQVWSFSIPPQTAYNQHPVDSVENVTTEGTNLTWSAGLGAEFHLVHFGTDRAAIEESEAGTLVEGTSFNTGPLEADTAYYWRVDEMDSQQQIYKGTVLSFTTVPVIDQIEDETLLGWWTFDQENSMSALDMSGHGLHAAASGDPQWLAEGVLGTAVELDGNDHFTTPALAGVETNTLTITAWIQPRQVHHNWTGILFSRQETVTSAGLLLKASNQLAYSWLDQEETYDFDTGLVVPMNEWSFTALVVEPDKARLYLDGPDLVVENLWQHAPDELTEVFRLGWDSHGADRHFVGAMDDLRLYTKALTPEELAQVMALGTKPQKPVDPLMIDDFEGYNAYSTGNDPNVWDVWIDGYGTTLNGSISGYTQAPFMERAITLDGGQSLPLQYDNTVAGISEIFREFSPALNLTQDDANTFVLYVRGDSSNTAEPTDVLTVALSDGNRTAEVVAAQAGELRKAQWKKIEIPLAGLDVDVTAIDKITLSIGAAGGTGVVYIDNITREAL